MGKFLLYVISIAVFFNFYGNSVAHAGTTMFKKIGEFYFLHGDTNLVRYSGGTYVQLILDISTFSLKEENDLYILIEGKYFNIGSDETLLDSGNCTIRLSKTTNQYMWKMTKDFSNIPIGSLEVTDYIFRKMGFASVLTAAQIEKKELYKKQTEGFWYDFPRELQGNWYSKNKSISIGPRNIDKQIVRFNNKNFMKFGGKDISSTIKILNEDQFEYEPIETYANKQVLVINGNTFCRGKFPHHQSLSGVRLGMQMEEVIKHFGQPSDIKQKIMSGNRNTIMIFQEKKIELYFVNEVLVKITVHAGSNLRFGNGLSVNSTIKDFCVSAVNDWVVSYNSSDPGIPLPPGYAIAKENSLYEMLIQRMGNNPRLVLDQGEEWNFSAYPRSISLEYMGV